VSTKRRTDPEARRGELVAAAAKIFVEKGVAKAAVSDIVKAAGVAQGTFYLYFDSKADIVNAVAEHIGDEMVGAIERSVAAARAGAVAKLLVLRDALLVTAEDPTAREIAGAYHGPENREVHDQMAERISLRLAPLVEEIVKQGVAEGVFVADNPRVAAWFVLGGLHAFERGFTDLAGQRAVAAAAMECALRTLGHAKPTPVPATRKRVAERRRAG